MGINYPPSIPLGNVPTPLQAMKNLSRALGGYRLFFKRDDLTGIELSGNKVRKLEFVLADARAKGADTLITYGGLQSNHCRAVAAAGAKLGFQVHLILRGTTTAPYEANLLLDRLFGAEVRFYPVEEFNNNKEQIIEETIEFYKKRGRKPYYFPVGASVPEGCWGYVKCFEEISQQLDRAGIKSGYLVTAVGSGGTLAGLILGQALLQRLDIQPVGINVCDTAAEFKTSIRQLLEKTCNQYELKIDPQSFKVEVIDGYKGEGYSIPYPEELEIIKLVGRLEGIALEPVYTGKAFYGAVDLMKKGKFQDSDTIIFLHTGGIFGLFPFREKFV